MLSNNKLVSSILINKNLFYNKREKFLFITFKKLFLFNSSKFFKKEYYLKNFLKKFFNYIYFFNFLLSSLPKMKVDIKYTDLKKKKKNLKIELFSNNLKLDSFNSLILFISFFNYFFKSVFIEASWYFLVKKNVVYLGLKNFMFLNQFFLKAYQDFFYQEKNFIFFKITFKKKLLVKWFKTQVLKILNEKK